MEKIVETPKYNSSNRKKRKLTLKIIERVKEYLAQNEKKRAIGQSKQQMAKKDIFEELQKSGYDIGYTTICNLIKKLRTESKEAFIKQEYKLGEICEFDWGETKLFIKGKLTKLQMAVFTGAKGNYRYSRLYNKQDTLSFHQSHSLFFQHIGGVYKIMVYDNMKVVVKKFVGYNEKEATEGLLKLSIYYNFSFRFCNCRKGNEKGHVERSVEYIRRKAFCKKDNFDSIEEANEHLLKTCENLNCIKQKYNFNKTAIEILNAEKPYLLPNLPLFEYADITELRADKYSTITVNTCHYSVPDKYVGKMILTKKYPEKILCFYEGKKIASHKRTFGFYQWKLELQHYLQTLKIKPGALKSSKVLAQAIQPIKNIYEKYYTDTPKNFIELLQYMDEKNVSITKILNAIVQLKKITPNDINTDKIKVLCERRFPEKKFELNVTSEITSKSKEQLQIITSFLSENQTLTSEVKII